MKEVNVQLQFSERGEFDSQVKSKETPSTDSLLTNPICIEAYRSLYTGVLEA